MRALENREFRAAAEHFQRGLEVAPDNPSLRHKLGTALAQMGDTRGAIAAFQETIRRTPSYAQAHYSLGVIAASAGRAPDAVRHLSDAIRYEPRYVEARLQLGEVLARTGQFEQAREHFKRVIEIDPRVADATILKLYPDRLQITITERRPFALWQKDKNVNVIAADGVVLEHYVSRAFVELPFVVGKGADKQAKDFLALLNRYPDVRNNVRASILIAERRWNLRLKNGLDVKLPETDVDRALERLASLDRELQLTSRDISVLDLRLPDRVTVQMSDALVQAREAAAKDKTKQTKKGGPV